MKNSTQRTIAKQVVFKGIGLHSGKPIEMKINPAPDDFGIVFKRTDVKESESLVEANFLNVTKTMLGTTIANKYGVEVATIEHLMAALWGCGIDNALIEIEGPEIPIMDGSSGPFVKALDEAGVVKQNNPRKVIVIKDEIQVGDEKRGAVLRPHKGFGIKFDIDFKDSAISRQHAKYEFKNGVFRHEIANARTFGFKEEVDAMNRAGLARGGSLENAIVIENGKILNDGGLRFDDEFVRHKILDACGDLFTSGHRIQGQFIGKKSGHQTNNEILRTLFDNPSSWEIV